MTGILFASSREAQPFIVISGASTVSDFPFPLYAVQSPRLTVAISGMGKVAAALAVQYLIREQGIRRIVFGGTCGALTDDPLFQTGRIFRIIQASEGAAGPGIPGAPVACDTTLWAQLPSATLVTVERPVFDGQRRQDLVEFGDLVDMEGAVAARVAAMYGVPCTILKGVTDFAGDGQRQLLQENLAEVSLALANILWKELLHDASGRFKA